MLRSFPPNIPPKFTTPEALAILREAQRKINDLPDTTVTGKGVKIARSDIPVSQLQSTFDKMTIEKEDVVDGHSDPEADTDEAESRVLADIADDLFKQNLAQQAVNAYNLAIDKYEVASYHLDKARALLHLHRYTEADEALIRADILQPKTKAVRDERKKVTIMYLVSEGCDKVFAKRLSDYKDLKAAIQLWKTIRDTKSVKKENRNNPENEADLKPTNTEPVVTRGRQIEDTDDSKERDRSKSRTRSVNFAMDPTDRFAKGRALTRARSTCAVNEADKMVDFEDDEPEPFVRRSSLYGDAPRGILKKIPAKSCMKAEVFPEREAPKREETVVKVSVPKNVPVAVSLKVDPVAQEAVLPKLAPKAQQVVLPMVAPVAQPRKSTSTTQQVVPPMAVVKAQDAVTSKVVPKQQEEPVVKVDLKPKEIAAQVAPKENNIPTPPKPKDPIPVSTGAKPKDIPRLSEVQGRLPPSTFYDNFNGLSPFAKNSPQPGTKAMKPAAMADDGMRREDRIKPTNPFGWKGIVVTNIHPTATVSKFERMFEKYGTITKVVKIKYHNAPGMQIVFDNCNSPAEAIYDLHDMFITGVAFNRRLQVRYYSGSNEPPRTQNRKWISEECFHWRTTGCDTQVRKCSKLHHVMCLGIDYQPWMDSYLTY
ncbi:hypothetical protein HDE_10917 [Halotydeus destructor]|nr:hypothetical protein HDE_10917 [Halotydeus destructor]